MVKNEAENGMRCVQRRGALGDGLSVGLCDEDKAVGGMGRVQGWAALGGLGLCGVWVHVEMERVGAVRGQDECRVRTH